MLILMPPISSRSEPKPCTIPKSSRLSFAKLDSMERACAVIESNFNKHSLLNLGIVHGLGSEWLQIGGIKMSIDGGITGKNAAFSEPIASDDDHHEGLIRIKQDELDETVELYHTLGMRICTHALATLPWT